MNAPAYTMPTTQRVEFRVLGTPAPKGSGRAMLVAGRAVHVPSGSGANKAAMRSWDSAVREVAARARSSWATGAPVFVGVPLRVELTFRMRRPGGHYGKRGLKPSAPAFPATKPDIDKLVRATLDSMTGAVFDDDSRIVELVARKIWAGDEPEGASVVVAACGGGSAGMR